MTLLSGSLDTLHHGECWGCDVLGAEPKVRNGRVDCPRRILCCWEYLGGYLGGVSLISGMRNRGKKTFVPPRYLLAIS